MSSFIDSIAKSHIQNPTKNSNRILVVNCFREKASSLIFGWVSNTGIRNKEMNYLTGKNY